MTYSALDDITVLDLSDRLAGSFCAKTLSLYGCDVIKIEPIGGDITRNWESGNLKNSSDSPLFLHLNSGKKSMTLNLEHIMAISILKALIKKSDVLIETFKPEKLASIGLSYHEIKSINPNIILTSITPYGQTGPYRFYEYDELTVFAMTGAMHREGLPERYPVRYGGETSQYFAGNTAASATTAALFKRLLHGGGEWIDISIQECMAGHPHQIGRRAPFVYAGDIDKRVNPRTSATGDREPYAVGTFKCKDGYFSFLPLGPRMWPNIAKMINREDLLINPRYDIPAKRTDLRKELEDIFQNWLNQYTRSEIFDFVQKAGIPGSPILRSDEVLSNTQFVDRGFFQTVTQPNGMILKMTGEPFRLTGLPKLDTLPAPETGEHTKEILKNILQMSESDVENLYKEAVI